jgi:hypothetical protein
MLSAMAVAPTKRTELRISESHLEFGSKHRIGTDTPDRRTKRWHQHRDLAGRLTPKKNQNIRSLP